VSLPNVLLNLLLEATPKVGKVFSDTNLRTEWEKACAACGLGTRAKIEGKDYRCHEGLIVHDLRRSPAEPAARWRTRNCSK
jgi:hypothetical protein